MPRADCRSLSQSARRRFAAALLAAPTLAGGDGLAEDGAGHVGAPAATTRSSAFAIPAGDLGDRGALAAVRLYRSTDGGISWRAAGTYPPDAVRLPHETARDGDYAFCVRGLDRRGGLHPPAAPAPEYRVLVDTAGPRLVLKAWWTDEDRVRVTVRCEDPHLVRDSVRVRLLPADPAAGWIDLTPGPEEATSWEGLVRIDLTRAIETPFDLTVRASASDEAGNVAGSVLPLPRPVAADADVPADDDVPLLSFDAPAAFTQNAPVPNAGGVNFAAAAAPAAGGAGFPAARFPVAAFPVAPFDPTEVLEPPAARFPVARFRLPAAAPAPAAQGWDTAPNAAFAPTLPADLGGWETAPPPESNAPPAPLPGAADRPDVLFDLGRSATGGSVVPASATAPPRRVPESPAADGPYDLYERLLAGSPEDRGLRLAYADRLLTDGETDAAARQLRALLRRDPADAEALRRLTACLAPPGGGPLR